MSFSSNGILTWVCCLAGRHLWSCRRRHTLPLSGRILLCCAQTWNMVACMNIEHLCSAYVQPLTPQNLWWKVGSPSLKLSFSHVYWNFHSDITCTLHPVSGVTPSSVTITLYQIDSKYQGVCQSCILSHWENTHLQILLLTPQIASSEGPWVPLCRVETANQFCVPQLEAKMAEKK